MADVTREVLSGRTLGEFRLLDCLDEGGFGAVYRCEQPLLGREAVVKVMHQRVQADEDARRRFSAEARLAARLDHPYAAHVYAHGIEEDGLVWIAMELVHGVSLKDYLDEHSSMSLEAFVPFFERLAEVVHAAHEQGIVHRDLKPANVMVCRGCMPKLLDFGVAKLLGDTAREAAKLPRLGPHDEIRRITGDLTPAGSFVGSPGYAAPEIWESRDTGPATDVYALGVIAFEAIAGRKPFRAETYLAYGAAHLTGEIPRAGDPALDRVFARALAKHPDDRYESALELAAALRGVLEGKRAAQRDAADRLRRRILRRRLSMVAAGVCAAAVVGAFQGVAHYNRRIAEQQAADAQELAHRVTLTAEVEQGRAALLGGDMQAAQQHLGAAWQLGARDRATRFMLDRAEQPRRAELARLPGNGRMWSASWSPDGALIATTDDQGAQIWDGATYMPLSPLPHGDTVYAAGWMGPTTLVTACGDGAVRVWDVGTGKVLAELALGGDGWPSVAFSSDGRLLAVSGGGAVEIVDAGTWRSAALPARRVHSLAWSPDGRRLLAGSTSGELSIWSAPTGKIDRCLREEGDPVDAVAFSADGTLVVAAERDGAERVFEAATGRLVSAGNHVHGRMTSIEFSPDARQLVASASSGLVAVSETASGRLANLFDAPHAAARSARFDPGSRRVVGATWDGVVWVWSATAPYLRWTAPALAEICGLIGGMDPDGRYLPVACVGHPTRVWDAARDQLLAELPALEDGERVPYPVVSSDGDRAAIARGSTAELYELPGGRLLGAVRHAARVTALAFGVDGELISGDAAGAVLAGDRAIAAGGGAGVDALAVLPSGQIAAADTSGRVNILDDSGAAATVFSTGTRARMLRPSPRGHRLLVVPSYAGPPAAMVLLDLDRHAVTQLPAPQVYAARWTSAGILSAHADGAARLWGRDGQLLRTLPGDRGFLADAAMTPDGATVVGVGGDQALHFWDMGSGLQIWRMGAQGIQILGVSVAPWGIVTRDVGGGVSRLMLPANPDKLAKALPFR